ncbi:hypothetical protein EVAR_46909_1 [Eumeta japonica]|uniref:Uncharacterized protein n=1 Tax=Eumeta variegata TaxID=151549 RepID=A0A4C1Y200_EUMVA|nr:hypothetical protein EVAR_46909_1 [Eumeta japonica]
MAQSRLEAANVRSHKASNTDGLSYGPWSSVYNVQCEYRLIDIVFEFVTWMLVFTVCSSYVTSATKTRTFQCEISAIRTADSVLRRCAPRGRRPNRAHVCCQSELGLCLNEQNCFRASIGIKVFNMAPDVESLSFNRNKFQCTLEEGNLGATDFGFFGNGGSNGRAGNTRRSREGHHGSRARQWRAVTTGVPGIGGTVGKDATGLEVVDSGQRLPTAITDAPEKGDAAGRRRSHGPWTQQRWTAVTGRSIGAPAPGPRSSSSSPLLTSTEKESEQRPVCGGMPMAFKHKK